MSRLSQRLAMVAMSMGLSLSMAQAQVVTERYVRAREGKTPEPRVAVDNVCAWPNLTVLPDQTIVATIHNQPSHGGLVADVECWASADGGQTWEKAGTPGPHDPGIVQHNVGAGLAQNGDLIVMSCRWLLDRKDWITPLWISRSPDGGRTWQIDKANSLSLTPSGQPVIPFGDILRGRDGDLLVAIYSYGPDRKGWESFIYRSRDDGRTWGDPVLIGPENETAVFHLGEGVWLAAGRLNGLTLYRSTDDGRTWNRQGPVTGAAQHPGHLMRLQDGLLLLSCGNRTEGGKGVDVRASGDEGKTWSEPKRAVDFDGDGGYPSSVQLPDGQILTAYYASQIAGHGRYHMGVVKWDPQKTFPEAKPE